MKETAVAGRYARALFLASQEARNAEAERSLILNFLDILKANKRLALLPLILARFQSETEKAQGRVRAQVRSAIPLDAAAQKEIEKALSAYFKKDVTVETTVEPGLLAGLVAQAGDTVIDGSLKNRLKNLQSILRSSHGH
ncbi:MAG: ATP synthase F1 subunit delta [Elusimicrobia bacterium RIFCSPLOWO2_01_FULL_54_10]|nr:MAG: ATP synthase F1 subunit delta [Elusimicrobia bacterium RIFCSPLOWO2_01_FULL_54_10]